MNPCCMCLKSIGRLISLPLLLLVVARSGTLHTERWGELYYKLSLANEVSWDSCIY